MIKNFQSITDYFMQQSDLVLLGLIGAATRLLWRGNSNAKRLNAKKLLIRDFSGIVAGTIVAVVLSPTLAAWMQRTGMNTPPEAVAFVVGLFTRDAVAALLGVLMAISNDPAQFLRKRKK